MIKLRNLKLRKWPEMSEDERADVLSWIATLCRSQGASWATSLLVASEFARGLDQ